MRAHTRRATSRARAEVRVIETELGSAFELESKPELNFALELASAAIKGASSLGQSGRKASAC